MKISGIYSIYSLENMRVCLYVGQSKDIYHRWDGHRYLLLCNSHHNIYLQKIFNRIGIDNLHFEVVEICSEDSLDKKERFYIKELKPTCNISIGFFDNKARQEPKIRIVLETIPEDKRDSSRPEWHKYVYGGAKKII